MLTKSITKLLKKSARVICQPDESGVIYVTDGHLIAVVTPEEYTKFIQPATQRAAALQGQLEHTKANMAAVVEDKSRLARQLQAAQAAQPATVEATPQPAPKPAASLAENLSRIPGATVKIAGENSRAPVIWITAADPDAAEAIRRAGGRWAEKKSAFYISVA